MATILTFVYTGLKLWTKIPVFNIKSPKSAHKTGVKKRDRLNFNYIKNQLCTFCREFIKEELYRADI